MKKFNELIQKSVTDDDFFVGTRINPDGTYSDYRFSGAEVSSGGAKRKIEINSQNLIQGVLSDDYFNLPVEEIVAGGTTYLLDDDFTQDTILKTITPVAFSFAQGQKILVKR